MNDSFSVQIREAMNYLPDDEARIEFFDLRVPKQERHEITTRRELGESVPDSMRVGTGIFEKDLQSVWRADGVDVWKYVRLDSNQ